MLEYGNIKRFLWKYKNVFAKSYVPNWSKEDFVMKRILKNLLWTYVISDLKGEEIVDTTCKKELLKTNQKSLNQKAINYTLNG